MRISPIDIQQKQFKSRPFGYEKTGVDQFLEMLAEELERLIGKNQNLQESLDRVNATLSEMREREETLKETLVTTQKITEELKSTARREVDVMMAEAEIKSERLMHNAEERRGQLIEEIQEIKRQKIDFEVSLRGLLEKHIRMIDLNTVALNAPDADARMLEEPLPFVEKKDATVEEASAEAGGPTEAPVEEAEFAEAEPLVPTAEKPESPLEQEPPELSFVFDSNDLNGDEDILK
ncbi:MAG: DivIVA domain-containing protein [Desulfuromonadales bacterium]|nr:DivIVA domain-containing protein [Desulfuromonadales bacterium]